MFGTIAMYAIQVLLAGVCVTDFGGRVISEVILSVHHFLFYAPTYLHTLMIYAFCKIDDFSWGTKGLDVEAQGVSFKAERNRIKKYQSVFKFIFSNIIVGAVLCVLVEYQIPKGILKN